MPSTLQAVSFDAHDPAGPAGFWAALLGRPLVEEPGGVFLPGDDTQVGLRFTRSDAARTGRNRLHLHLTSDTSEAQHRTVATALELGASHLDVGQRPEEGHIVLADPAGNEFCVIEAGNAFLAGCGFLGEIACEGSRATGVFWSEALGWPLVWDENGETAVQSPAGGTKIAWGGPPVTPPTGSSRQRFDLTAGDRHAEADRLVALGAKVLETGTDTATVLADPDGNEFRLTSGAVPGT